MLLARGRDRRARDVPSARPSARDARPARGVSPRDRDAVRPRLRARRDAEPVHPLQRQLPLRRAARLRASAPAATGSRPATTHGSQSIADACCLHRGADDAKDQSYMLARLDPKHLERIWFPLGEQDKDATRAEAATRGSRGRAARREPGGVLPRRRRLPRVPRAQRARAARRQGRRRARRRRSATTTASGGSRRASARASASSAAKPLYVLDADAALERGRSSARTSRSRAGGCEASGPALRRRRSRRREAAGIGRPPSRPACRAARRGFTLELDEPAYGVARGQAAVLYEGDAVVGLRSHLDAADN